MGNWARQDLSANFKEDSRETFETCKIQVRILASDKLSAINFDLFRHHQLSRKFLTENSNPLPSAQTGLDVL